MKDTHHPPHHHHHHDPQEGGDDDHNTMPAKLRVLIDFARHQEETIVALEQQVQARDQEIVRLHKEVAAFKALLLKSESRTIALLERMSL